MIDRKRVIVFRGLATASVLSFLVLGGDQTLAQWILVIALLLAAPLFIHWSAQAAPLKPADNSLEPSSKPAWRVAMFVPGSGRTALLLVTSLAMVLASFLAGRAIWLYRQALWGSDDPVQLTIIVCYALIYVLLPSTLLAPLSRWAWGRGVIRVAIVALLVVPSLWYALRSENQCFVCDPFAMLNLVTKRGPVLPCARRDLAWLVSIAIVAVAISVPRMINGVREVARGRRSS